MLRSRSLHVLLWFVFIGPLIGAMLYLPEKAVLNGTFRADMLQTSLYVFLAPVAFLGAYALFLVPSAATGVVAALISRPLSRPLFVLATTLFGGIVSIVYIETLGRVPVMTLITSAVLGASVAFCCALLAAWTGG